MSILATSEFGIEQVRFVGGKPVANDVAKVLGYTDPAATVSKKVFPENRNLVKVQTNGGVQSAMVLEEKGVLQLVSSSRLPNAVDIAKKLNLFVFHASYEQDSIRILESAFSDLQPIRQFTVHGYRIDLYLAKINVAIECDENDHAYGYPRDRSREKQIKSALGCSFVRYNPNEAQFNLGCVILAVRNLIP